MLAKSLPASSTSTTLLMRSNSVSDEGPRHAQYSRIFRERPAGELRQLPIIAGRQVGPDFADLLFNEMIIVDQPFRRRCNRVPSVDRLSNVAMRIEQYGGIVSESAGQGMAPDRFRNYCLRSRETPSERLEAPSAEELFANWPSIVPR